MRGQALNQTIPGLCRHYVHPPNHTRVPKSLYPKRSCGRPADEVTEFPLQQQTYLIDVLMRNSKGILALPLLQVQSQHK